MSALVNLPVVNADFMMYSYLFVHEEIKSIPRAERTLDQYWKGTVKGIRRAPYSKVWMFLNVIIFQLKCGLVYSSCTCEVVLFS
jgi:hypothetical protein